MKTLLSMLCLLFAAQSIASNVGFTQVTVGSDSDRPVLTSIWYPTLEQFPIIKVAENPVFVGTSVIQDAKRKSGQFPLVLLSHGYRGSWRNLNWLATHLAKDGYMVAAVDHAGTAFYSHAEKDARQWWQRPRDLSRALDWLLTSKSWQDSIDQQAISAVGHSLGAWTVMLLAGAQMNAEQLKSQYQAHPNPRVVAVAAEMQVNHPAPSAFKDLHDPRITRVVSLDLGLARGFSVDSLKSLTTPTLLLSAGIDIGDLDEKLETGFLAEHIPLMTRRYKTYSEALHFSFMQVCKTGAIDLLEEESPGDGIICKDGKTARTDLHNQMYQDILAFLK